MQISGIGEVAWGIHKTRELFEQPPFLRQGREWFRQWMDDRPKHRRHVTLKGEGVFAAVSVGKGCLSIWKHPSSGATVEQEIEVIKTNLVRVRDDLRTLEDRVEGDTKKQDTAIRQER